MNRDKLKELGLTDEQINAVMKQNGKDIENAKGEAKEYESVKKALEDAEEQIKQRDAQIEKLSEVDADKLQAEIKKLQADNEKAMKQKEAEIVAFKKETNLKATLKEKGVKDVDYLLYKMGGLDKFAFDSENKAIGVDELISSFKESHAFLFDTDKKATYTPQGGSKSTVVKNPFSKDAFNLTEQGKLLRDNPAQAKELAAAAGVELNI